MSILDYIKLLLGIGESVLRLAQSGKKVIRLSEVLPASLPDKAELDRLYQDAKDKLENKT